MPSKLLGTGRPTATGCDRLDAAFAALEADGVVARQNFTYCNTCGHAEIAEARDDGQEVVGYALYHMQDTESAVAGCGVYLRYGAVIPGREAAADIGRRVVAAVQAAGLSADWDGDTDCAIGVPLVWRKRRVD